MSNLGSAPFRLRDLTFSVYLPTILFSIGQGAVIPITPLFARELGASVAAAGLIVALRAIGQVLFDLPAGVFVSKYGDKFAMIAGTALVGTVAIGCAFSSSPVVLGLLMILMGGGWAFWQLARLAYVSEIAPLEQRGRALSMLGGTNRVGNFIGPVIGGYLGQHFGLESAFYAQAAMGLAAAALMFVVARESSGSEHLGGHGAGGRLVQTAIDHRAVFLTAGPPILILGVLRQARQVFLPLWGDSLGLNISQIGLITSMSFLIDSAVFYPVGAIMDRYGRKFAAVPCLATLSLGLLILPLTNDFATFMAVAALSGMGNGFGAGIVMTLGADFSPETGRGEFLGVWRLISDVGQAGGPLVISLLTALGSLAVASLATGGLGLIGTAMMLFLVKETLNKPVKPVTAGAAPGT